MSNITIFYGYGFEFDVNVDQDTLNIFENLAHEKKLQFFSCYSVSAYSPDTFAIGIRVMPNIEMFNPVRLQNKLLETEKNRVDSALSDIRDILAENYSVSMLNETAEYMVLGYSDD